MIENASCVSLLDRGIYLDHEVTHVRKHKVHHDVNVIFVLMEIIHFCNARMIHSLHDLFLSVNGFEFFCLQLLLLVNFDGNISTGFLVKRFVNVGLASLANDVFDGVASFERQKLLLLTFCANF